MERMLAPIIAQPQIAQNSTIIQPRVTTIHILVKLGIRAHINHTAIHLINHTLRHPIIHIKLQVINHTVVRHINHIAILPINLSTNNRKIGILL